ncbi:GNAT family N-acetyltransferase [Pontivivens ytuae]|uniref:GNAT family N-acetyltransferase n=1 Tax=Pontivivens ytuae TaxID=2789856 RepID=A0A7S9LTJ6_9RHOB|nr:GNAT family N-acetyltransferase [Pontivivens ytuae]QPH55036.1 GNAT family N-acetyltransferase [Pontivivens ytuae]
MEIETAYRPGLIAEILQLHMDYYAPVWGLGSTFEAYQARNLGDFLAQYDANRDLIATVRHEGRLAASMVVDLTEPDAGQLRWFIINDALRGRGLGRTLMEQACAHLDGSGVVRAWLSTYRGLDAALHLYGRFGFVRLSEEPDPWGSDLRYQVWERVRPTAG